MKRVLGVCFAVGLFTLSIQERAEAQIVDLRICHGVYCVNVPREFDDLASTPRYMQVGDYGVTISGAWAFLLGSDLQVSLSRTAAIDLVRVALNYADPLQIWQSVQYIPNFIGGNTFVTTMGATSSPGDTEVKVTYQGWYSPTNGGFIHGPKTAAPSDGITAGPIGCVIYGGSLRRTGATACSTRPGVINVDYEISSDYSLVTLTTVDIPTVLKAIYSVTAQASLGTIP